MFYIVFSNLFGIQMLHRKNNNLDPFKPLNLTQTIDDENIKLILDKYRGHSDKASLEEQEANNDAEDDSSVVTLESKHPYDDNADDKFTLEVPDTSDGEQAIFEFITGVQQGILNQTTNVKVETVNTPPQKKKTTTNELFCRNKVRGPIYTFSGD